MAEGRRPEGATWGNRSNAVMPEGIHIARLLGMRASEPIDAAETWGSRRPFVGARFFTAYVRISQVLCGVRREEVKASR